MAVRRLGIVMNGVTGRMGTNQHLVRSIVAIRAEGGVALANGDRVMPDPILVGRSEEKLAALAKAHGLSTAAPPISTRRWPTRTTPSSSTPPPRQMRPALLAKAIAAGKHIYCEKPVATNLEEALGIVRKAKAAGIKHGVVQDKLFLPGLRKLKLLIDSGFFGRILAVRGEFGYWVFEGDLQPAQRPSWNYRAEDGGGIILDMLCHWRYVLDNTFGNVKSVSCLGATHIPERIDEAGKRYKATADDAAYATFQLDGGIIAHINCSWATRVRRDDLLDLARRRHARLGGRGPAGRRRASSAWRRPSRSGTPTSSRPSTSTQGWQPVPETQAFDNGFKLQWEAFIRHVAEGAPYNWDLMEGAKGVQLVECALRSWKERRWIDVPELKV